MSAGGAYYTRTNAGVWQKEFRVSDHLGSIRAIVTNSTTDNFDYDAFGKAAQPTKRWSYLGREKEFENSTSEFGFRKYDEETGSFLQPDPLWAAFPDQSPYQYGYNSPLNWSDASGLANVQVKRSNDAIDENGHCLCTVQGADNCDGSCSGGGGGGQSDWFRENEAAVNTDFAAMQRLFAANAPGERMPGTQSGWSSKFNRGIFMFEGGVIPMGGPAQYGSGSGSTLKDKITVQGSQKEQERFWQVMNNNIGTEYLNDLVSSEHTVTVIFESSRTIAAQFNEDHKDNPCHTPVEYLLGSTKRSGKIFTVMIAREDFMETYASTYEYSNLGTGNGTNSPLKTTDYKPYMIVAHELGHVIVQITIPTNYALYGSQARNPLSLNLYNGSFLREFFAIDWANRIHAKNGDPMRSPYYGH